MRLIQVESSSALRRMLDLWLPQKIRYDQIPGMSVAIMQKGKILYSRGFGYSNIQTKKHTTTETQYRIASISKIFTAVAIMQLAGNERLSLNDQIKKYIPELKISPVVSRKLTIARLLSHTSGLWRDGDTPQWVTDNFSDLRQVLRLTNQALIFRGKKQFKYSNFGYALLGEIIHRTSGWPYDQYIKRNIINQLKLRGTIPDYITHQSNLAVGYSRVVPGEAVKSFRHVSTRAFAPATGFISTAPDLAKFISTFSPKRLILLQKKSKYQMTNSNTLVGFGKEKYGFGLALWNIGTKKIIGHGGGFAGFSTQASYCPELDLAVVVLSNSLGNTAPALNEGILKMAISLAENSRFSKKSAVVSKSFDGVYRSRWGDKVVVSNGQKLLSFDVQLNDPVAGLDVLWPAGKNEFTMCLRSRYDAIGERVKFIAKPNNRTKIMYWGPNPMKRVEGV